MAGGRERELRRRIRSVRSTRKITKAMELIAASQIARAQARIADNRPYRDGMQRVLAEAVAGDPDAAARVTGTPERVQRAVVVSIVGDRGLAGPYNGSVLRMTERCVAELRDAGVSVELVTVGRKAHAYFRFRRIDVARAFQGFSDRPGFDDARKLAAAVSAPFRLGEADQVLLVSMRFLSAGRQEVATRQLLPLPTPEQPEGSEPSAGGGGYTEFEPEVAELLDELAPAMVQAELFTALLEGAAAFHTSQQRAMAAATENADELVRTLTREMNRARQDSITTEIMEIVGGAEALRQEKEHA